MSKTINYENIYGYLSSGLAQWSAEFENCQKIAKKLQFSLRNKFLRPQKLNFRVKLTISTPKIVQIIVKNSISQPQNINFQVKMTFLTKKFGFIFGYFWRENQPKMNCFIEIFAK